jgi:hypothetical protein
MSTVIKNKHNFLDPSWHMIFGGNDYPYQDSMRSVELYNWKTGEQCQLEDLPYGVAAHSGIVLEGTPAFCGGGITGAEKRCYKFDKTNSSWIWVRGT